MHNQRENNKSTNEIWKPTIKGTWSVIVQLHYGNLVPGFGEFCEVSFPNKVVMTRRFSHIRFLAILEIWEKVLG